MKKKILLLAIITLTILAGYAGANAAPAYVGATGATHIDDGFYNIDDDKLCRYGGYSGTNGVDGVRITVVDSSGNRVSRSADFHNGTLSWDGIARAQSTDKKTRNEIVNGGMSYTWSSSQPELYYWANLPDFNNGSETGGGTLLSNYFITKFSTADVADMMWIFGILGYDGYQNSYVYENHYLLVEPIYKVFMTSPIMPLTYDYALTTAARVEISDAADEKCKDGQWANVRGSNGRYLFVGLSESEGLRQCRDYFYDKYKGLYEDNPDYYNEVAVCSWNRYYYYGTATEIFYMMKNSGDPLYNYKVGQGGSIETVAKFMGGLVHDNASVAGLIDASAVASDRNAAYNNMLSRYGLGSMHVWMKYIMDGCPNGVCPTYCPDGVTPIPEGQTAEEVCPPSYCPDMKTVIPPGKTAAEVCPGYTPTCKYDLKTKITNDCTDGQEGYIRDIGEDENGTTNLDEWKCIFDTANAPMNTYEGEFYHPNGSTFFDNNPYCKVACRETVKYKLPSTFEEVAGRKFTIGISNEYASGLGPNIIEGTSTCSTAYYQGTETPFINYELFKVHYAEANKTVEAAWDAYQIELAKEKSANDIISEYQSGSGEHNCADSMMCPGGQSENTSWHECQWDKLNGKNLNRDCGERYIQNPDRHCERSRGECPNGPFEHDGQSGWTQTTHVGRVYSYKGQNYQITYVTSSDGHHGDNKPSFNTAALKAAYDTAVAQRTILVEALNMCNNFQRTYSEFEPALSFAYSETKYKGSYKLAATSQTTAITNYLVNNQSVGIHEWTTAGYENNTQTFISDHDINHMYGSIDYIDRTDCGSELQPCINNVRAQAYPNNISVIQTTRKTYNYELPSNANRYVAKNGKSYNTASDAELSDYPYMDTGRSNMPINFETPGGWYHYYYDYYYADGTANLFGTNQKFLKYNKVEPGGTSSYNGLTLADNLLYHCIYKVDCGLVSCDSSNTCPDGSEMPPNGKCPDYTVNHKICPSGVPMPISGYCPDTKGINIIYRTISLRDPFPGEHGDGRDAGANWNGMADVLGTRKTFIDAYITNNRGVDTEKVYQQTPMYQFTLTPANIRAIRKYNRSQNADYNDFNLECTNGKYCKSEFLENGIGEGYFGFTSKNPNGGACFNTYSADDWEACRYTNIGG